MPIWNIKWSKIKRTAAIGQYWGYIWKDMESEYVLEAQRGLWVKKIRVEKVGLFQVDESHK